MKFGRLTVVSHAGSSRGRLALWNCLCDCGVACVKVGGDLRNGDTSSCGCFKREQLAMESRVRNKTHGLSFSPTYYSWKSMIQRCDNPRHSAYQRYGGAGIGVCERWHSFDNFLADMGTRPANMTLDRIDNLRGYSQENCRWATRSQQANNRNENLAMSMNGTTKLLTEWAAEYGQTYQRVYRRIHKNGWTLHEALTTPPRPMARRDATLP